MAKSEGKKFEEDIKTSTKKDGIFFYRIKDTYIPPELRTKIFVSKNLYDSFLYYKPYLIPIELKSGKGKSFSFDEKIIKKHQEEALLDAINFPGVIAGFVFNFRDLNETYFVHILDYKDFKDKTDRKSISLDYCRNVGIEIKSKIARTRRRYLIKDFVEELSRRNWG